MIKRRGSALGRNSGSIIHDDGPATPFTISTPYRLLRTPLTEISETPYAIKYPLLAFLNSKVGATDLEINMKAQKITSHAAQQGIIAKVEAMQDLCIVTNKQHLTLISELKRQYILALLDDLDDSEAILSTLRHLQKAGPAITQPAAAPLEDIKENRSPDGKAPEGRKLVETEQIAPTPDGVASRTRSKSASTEVGSRGTPSKSTPSNPTPIGQTPLNVLKRNHVNRLRIQTMTQKIATEPEHVQAAVRKRLSCIVEEPDEEAGLANAMTNVVYSAKRPQGMIQTPSKKLRITPNRFGTGSPNCSSSSRAMNQSAHGQPFSVAVAIGETPEVEDLIGGDDSIQTDSPGKACRPSELSTASVNMRRPQDQNSNYVTKGITRGREYNGLISLISRSSESDVFDSIREEEDEDLEPVPDTPPMKKKTRSSNAEGNTDVTTAQSNASLEQHSCQETANELDQVKVNRRSSVASMFTSRGAPQKGNKFQSRVSLTAKLRRTREKRQMRKLRADLDEADSQKLEQAGPRMRKLERFEALAESKFTAFTDKHHLDNLVEVVGGGDRSALLTVAFDTITLRPKWHSLLRELYGHSTFRDHQEESLEYLWSYSEGPLLLSLPTGAGKSMVFTLAGAAMVIANNGLCVMILPTKALVSDQFDAATRQLSRHFNVLKLHSGLDVADYAKVYKGLANGLVDYLLTTPEQFISTSLLAVMRKGPRPLSLVCVDEAHCLSEWSHTFRPAYQSVLAVANHYFSGSRLLMMTATITRETEESITSAARALNRSASSACKILRVRDGHWREDLTVCVQHANDVRLDAVERAMTNERRKWTRSTQLIFVWMKYQAEQLVRHLKERGMGDKIYFYHSEVSEAEKARLVGLLANGEVDILVSTQALGMGLDVSHITNVYHLSVPASIEQWLQEMGRCNRDKRSTRAMCYGFGVFKEYWKRRQKTAASIIDEIAVSQFFKRIMTEEDHLAQHVTSAKEMRFKVNSKAHALSIIQWQGPAHSVTVVSMEGVKSLMNCWSEEEIHVMTAIVDRKCLEDRINGEELFGWWILNDYELRCFDRDLDELGESGGIITALRASQWRDKPNQGVFKLRWSELLMDSEITDPPSIRDQIFTVCQENKISIRAVSGTRRLHIVKRRRNLTDLGRELVRRISGGLLKNNEAQLRKQEMVRLAWKVCEECGEDSLKRLLQQYFDGTLVWPVQDAKLRGWLYEGVQFLEDPGARAVFYNDVSMLRECLAASYAPATPLACSRVLCGIQRANHAAQPWQGRYECVPFEVVLELAR